MSALSAAAVLVLVAGCGSGSSSTAAGGAATAPPTTAPAPGAATVPGAAPGSTSGGTGSTPGSTVSPASSGSGATTWTGYHADAARTGAVPAGRSLDPLAVAWTAPLGGVVHGQAVVADGRVLAATEDNRVVALDPRSGRVLWSTSLGRPLTNVSSVAGCGDIDPLGITSTPVVDTRTGTVYVVAEVSTGGSSVHHQLEGLSVATGAVRMSADVDPPLPAGEHAVNLLQRASLALGRGRVYVGYGGNDGDCARYHGWLVGVDETGAPHEVSFEVASDGEGGAIWQSGGAPAVDAAGNVYVSTGNADPAPPAGGPDPKRYTESVVKLSPDLRVEASYKDETAGGDEDLSTGNPVLLPDGDVFAVGKTDTAYVLRQRDLSEVAAIHGICGSNPDGGPAFDVALDRMFVPCEDGGIQVVDLGSRTLGPLLSQANSAPILIGTDVWSLQLSTHTLTEFDAASGRVVQRVDVGQAVPKFTSPSSALGLLLVPTDTGVTAFTGR